MATDVVKPEEDPEYWFKYSATLRIFGDIGDLGAITGELGVRPTRTHRRGEKRLPTSILCYEHGMWSYAAPVPEDRPLDVHLEALWRVVRPHVAYLKGLTERLTVDVFCGCRTNCGSAGFEVDHRALVIFTEREVPFGVSVLLTFKIFEPCADFLTLDGDGVCGKRRNLGAHSLLSTRTGFPLRLGRAVFI